MRRLIRSPWLWLTGFVVWFSALWWLSSGVPEFPSPLQFRASDKLLHFGYFFGGAGLISAFLYRLNPTKPRWGRIFVISVAAAGLTGVLDEWHQSFVPGRSGNDPGDIAADLLGAACGALVFRKVRRLVD